MKLGCRVHGCHFGDEFEQTLDPGCPFWSDMGAAQLSDDMKRKFWDWVITIPADEIFVKENLMTSFAFGFQKVEEGQKLENLIPGYAKMDEATKRVAQRIYFESKPMKPIVPKDEIRQHRGLLDRIFRALGISLRITIKE